MEKNNAVYLPVDEWIWMVNFETRRALNEAGLKHDWLDDDFFKCVVLHIVEDTLYKRSLWANHKISNLEKWYDSLDWFQLNTEFTDILYCSIDIICIPRISDLIEMLIPEEPYRSWNLIKISSKDFYVAVRGEDYRVLEYYRLKEQYEPNTVDNSNYKSQVVKSNFDNLEDFADLLVDNIEVTIKEEDLIPVNITADKLIAEMGIMKKKGRTRK